MNHEKYTFCVIKSLEHLKTDHACLQSPNPSHETVPLMTTFPFILLLGYWINSALFNKKRVKEKQPCLLPDPGSKDLLVVQSEDAVARIAPHHVGHHNTTPHRNMPNSLKIFQCCGSGFNGVPGSGPGQEDKNDPQTYKTVNKFHFLMCWMFYFEE